MLKMNEMPYVIGITMRLYPSNAQKDIIAYNDGATRFIYNRLVARHQELFSLRKVKVFMKPVADRIAYLESLGENSSDFKANYPFLEDKRIDAQMIANAIMNYRTAWHNFSTKPGTSIPTFHKKGYDKRYQTNAHYPKDASTVSDGNVYLPDKCHIQLPKLGTVRFAGSERIREIFMRTSETRIIGVVVQPDWEKTGANIFKIYGMNSSYLSVTTTTKIIAENGRYDVIIVDESDKLSNSHLEILQKMGQRIILMYDELQSIRPDNITREMFKQLTAGYEKKCLHTQFRL